MQRTDADDARSSASCRPSRRRSAAGWASTRSRSSTGTTPNPQVFTRDERDTTTILLRRLDHRARHLDRRRRWPASATTSSRSTVPTSRRCGSARSSATAASAIRPTSPSAIWSSTDRTCATRRACRRRDHRQLRVPHGGRVRPVPLRHLRHRVPQGAARCRLRRIPRPAVPAAGRPRAGDGRRRRPRAERRVFHGAWSRRSWRATCSTHRLSDPSVRGRSRRHRRALEECKTMLLRRASRRDEHHRRAAPVPARLARCR